MDIIALAFEKARAFRKTCCMKANVGPVMSTTRSAKNHPRPRGNRPRRPPLVPSPASPPAGCSAEVASSSCSSTGVIRGTPLSSSMHTIRWRKMSMSERLPKRSRAMRPYGPWRG